MRDLLLSDGVRIVTLTGPGGTGKSRLGLRVATELLHSFEGRRLLRAVGAGA